MVETRNFSLSFSYSEPVDQSGQGFTMKSFAGPTQTSMLQSALSSNLKTSVSVSNMKQHQVSAGMANAASQVQPNRAAVQSVQDSATGTKAAISSQIRGMQAEVVAATKACGHDPGQLFPDTRIAGSEFELAAQAVFPALVSAKAQVFGPLVAQAVDHAFIIEDARSLSKSSKSTPQKEAEIKDKLIQASSGAQDTRVKPVNIMAMDAPEPQMQSRYNWEEFFANGHDLKTLMSLDPDNPNPDLVPEWRALDQVDANAEATLATLNYVESQTIDMGRDNTQDSVNSWNSNQRDLLSVANARETLPYLGGSIKWPEGMDVMASVGETKIAFRAGQSTDYTLEANHYLRQNM